MHDMQFIVRIVLLGILQILLILSIPIRIIGVGAVRLRPKIAADKDKPSQ